MTRQTITTWLTRQTEYDYRPEPETISVVPDPQVPGTWAVQFTDADRGETVQLLFVTGLESGTDEEILSRCLEEVEFASWPPRSGSLQFFV